MKYKIVLDKSGYEIYEVEAESKEVALEKVYDDPDKYLVDDDMVWHYDDVEITEIINEI